MKVLVVDDEPAIAAYMEAIVARCGHETRCAYDGDEAVSVAREFRPDAVFTGIIMPRLSGLEATKQILEFLPDCKFLFCSGSASESYVRGPYAELGFDEQLLLEKPFNAADVVRVLNLAGIPSVLTPPLKSVNDR
jgi:CheY-like chemotaxis protein